MEDDKCKSERELEPYRRRCERVIQQGNLTDKQYQRLIGKIQEFRFTGVVPSVCRMPKGLPPGNLRSRLVFISVYPIHFRQEIFNLVSFFSVLNNYSTGQRKRAYNRGRQILLNFLSLKTKQVSNEDCQEGDLNIIQI